MKNFVRTRLYIYGINNKVRNPTLFGMVIEQNKKIKEGLTMAKTTKRNKNNGNKEFAIFIMIIAAVCTLIMCIPTNNTPCTYSKCDCYSGYGFSYSDSYHCDVHMHDCLN